MIIGVQREIKNNETRAGLIPGDVKELTESGHTVYVQTKAGEKSGFSDEDYVLAGAKILNTIEEVYGSVDMVVGVKELEQEHFPLLRENLIIATCLHSNAHPEEVDALLENKVIGIAYEDLTAPDGSFPALKLQSPIAAKGAFLMAAYYMSNVQNGAGVMLAKIPGCRAAHVTVLGAGYSGCAAAEAAAGMGNHVTLMDISLDKLNGARALLPPNVEYLLSSRTNIEECLKKTDLLMNCVPWPKNRKDYLVTREMLRKYAKKTLFIADVACDVDGALETCIKSTSHSNPLYIEEGIVHYTVDNIPAAYGRTSAQTFSQAGFPFIQAIANKGVDQALKDDQNLRRGLTCYKGILTLEETALKQHRPYKTPEEVLGLK